jgi:hypothetical protein
LKSQISRCHKIVLRIYNSAKASEKLPGDVGLNLVIAGAALSYRSDGLVDY